MSPPDLLTLMVEASLALAGFAGVVTALGKRSTSELSPLERLSFGNLVFTSLGALFLSLFSLGLLSAAVSPATVWRIGSAASLCTTLYGAYLSVRTVADELGARRAWRTSALYVINLPLSVVCVALIWNVATLGAFWPVFLVLIAWFGIACFSFVRLVYGLRA